MTISTTAHISNKAIQLARRELFWEQVFNEIPDDSDVLITIEYLENLKTYGQIKFYWGVVLPIIAKCLEKEGMILSAKDKENKQLIHLWLKKRFLGSTKHNYIDFEGNIVNEELIPSLRQLTKNEMKSYIELCEQFLAEKFDIAI
jgi:hypothetical protein